MIPTSTTARTRLPSRSAPRPPRSGGVDDRVEQLAGDLPDRRERPGTGARVGLGLARVAAGTAFLWPFLDKTFGLGYATPAARAWIAGGSPTAGFLGSLEAGPFATVLGSLAGPVVDWAFMLGLLAIGVATVLGVGVRIAAVGGSVLLALMWVAEWPPARFTSAGEPTMSTNPVVDSHVLLAALLITLALVSAGRHLGLGSWWERIVGRRRWLV